MKNSNSKNKQSFNTYNCPIYDILSNNDSLYISYKEANNKLYIMIAKIKLQIFGNHEALFNKGKKQNNDNLNENNEQDLEKITKSSYFKSRYYLFSRFDEGIKLDEESKIY